MASFIDASLCYMFLVLLCFVLFAQLLLVLFCYSFTTPALRRIPCSSSTHGVRENSGTNKRDVNINQSPLFVGDFNWKESGMSPWNVASRNTLDINWRFNGGIVPKQNKYMEIHA